MSKVLATEDKERGRGLVWAGGGGRDIFSVQLLNMM